MSILLSERDRLILLFLWQNQFVTFRQLRLRFWNGGGGSRVGMRLNALQEAGFLTIQDHKYLRLLTDADRRLIHITVQGCTELVRAGALDKAYIRDAPTRGRQVLKRHTLSRIHDLQVVDLRIALSKTLKVTRWVSDHELRLARRESGQKGVRVPDGVFTFISEGVEIEAVLENEQSRYSARSFQEILERLKRQHAKAIILMVCEEEDHMESMIRWARAGRTWNDAQGQLLFGHFGEVMSLGAKAPWRTMVGPIDEGHPLRRATL
jgi:hypothetical protein